MNNEELDPDSMQDLRFQAVLAALKGDPISEITRRYGIGRKNLYKLRKKAIVAIKEAVKIRKRGPKIPHNRLFHENEEQIKFLCKTNPTCSSYEIEGKIGKGSPSARTIQRIRNKHNLPRFPKRSSPKFHCRHFLQSEKKRIFDFMEPRSHLGSLRMAWDITNILKISISSTTVFRWRQELTPKANIEVINWQFYERKHPHSLWHGDLMRFPYHPNWGEYLYQLTLSDDYSRAYIYCELILEPTSYHTIEALIQSIREWEVIPTAVLFDNGSEFKGKLLQSFCENLGIKIIHSSVNHPQTNGKQERAFRDDKQDFYGLREGWTLEALRKDLPDYIYYRNYQRGHWALKGRPSITRLEEQNRKVLPSVLNCLESYASNEIDKRKVDSNGYIKILTRPAYVGKEFGGTVVNYYESLNGLEIRKNGLIIGILPDFQEYKRLLNRYSQYPGMRRKILPKSFILQTTPNFTVIDR